VSGEPTICDEGSLLIRLEKKDCEKSILTRSGHNSVVKADAHRTASGDTLNPAKARILLMLALTRFVNRTSI
jgi:L-asparaginase/Glu-tRNA(Gln) amidotransferase subunit D